MGRCRQNANNVWYGREAAGCKELYIRTYMRTDRPPHEVIPHTVASRSRSASCSCFSAASLWRLSVAAAKAARSASAEIDLASCLQAASAPDAVARASCLPA